VEGFKVVGTEAEWEEEGGAARAFRGAEIEGVVVWV
jgi:hypothetical protein